MKGLQSIIERELRFNYFLDVDETDCQTCQLSLHSAGALRHHDCRHHPPLSLPHLLRGEASGLYQ